MRIQFNFAIARILQADFFASRMYDNGVVAPEPATLRPRVGHSLELGHRKLTRSAPCSRNVAERFEPFRRFLPGRHLRRSASCIVGQIASGRVDVDVGNEIPFRFVDSKSSGEAAAS